MQRSCQRLSLLVCLGNEHRSVDFVIEIGPLSLSPSLLSPHCGIAVGGMLTSLLQCPFSTQIDAGMHWRSSGVCPCVQLCGRGGGLWLGRELEPTRTEVVHVLLAGLWVLRLLPTPDEEIEVPLSRLQAC